MNTTQFGHVAYHDMSQSCCTLGNMCSKQNTCTKYDDIAPYLQYIESRVFLYLGRYGEAFQHVLKRNLSDEYRAWTHHGYMSVQEAVTTVLIYYRQVMAQYFVYCRNNSISVGDKTTRIEIYTAMNNFETAVWENDWYQCPCYNDNTYQKKYSKSNDCTLTCEEVQLTSTQAPLVDTKKEKNTMYPKEEVEVYPARIDNLLTECIDEDAKQKFLHDISSTTNNDYNDISPDNILNVIHDDNSQSTFTSQQNENIKEYMSLEDNLGHDIMVFKHGVNSIRYGVSKNLTRKQHRMLDIIIAKCNNEVASCQLSTVDALTYVSKALHFLESDQHNEIDI